MAEVKRTKKQEEEGDESTPSKTTTRRADPTTIIVANHHTGGIMFPRRGEGGITLPPLRLAPGTTTTVDAEEWKKRKKMKVIQYYLDAGILSEVSREGAVPVSTATSTELPVPEHLQAAEQTGKEEPVKASVRKQNAGEVKIS